MTTPALTVTFPPGNTIHYLQDFTFRIGMPADVVFTVVKVTERGVELRAPGYGGKPYGNGCIYISFSAGRDELLTEIAQLRTALQKTLGLYALGIDAAHPPVSSPEFKAIVLKVEGIMSEARAALKGGK